MATVRKGTNVRGGAALVAVLLALLLYPAAHLAAAFPGADGLIAFEQEGFHGLNLV